MIAEEPTGDQSTKLDDLKVSRSDATTRTTVLPPLDTQRHNPRRRVVSTFSVSRAVWNR